MVGVSDMRLLNGLAGHGDHPGQELDDRSTKDVVTITGDHVSRPEHVDVLGMRAESQKLRRALFAQDIGETASNQQRGQLEVAGTCRQPLRACVATNGA